MNGSETTSSKSVQLSDESSKFLFSIINNSVIYNLNESEHKNRTNCIVRQLKRLSKVEQIQKHKPNPYAKFYISHLKRKQENNSSNSVSQTVTTNTTNNSLNGLINNSKIDKPVNGLSSPKHQIKYNSVPINGLHNNSESSSVKISSADKKPSLNYRQSPRSLLRPKLMSPSNVINSKKDNTFPTLVPVLTRSTLSGYKIPKKKQEQNSQSLSKFSLGIQSFYKLINYFKK